MMGLMFHTNAKALMRREQYRDALEVLTMGEVIDYTMPCTQKEKVMELVFYHYQLLGYAIVMHTANLPLLIDKILTILVLQSYM